MNHFWRNYNAPSDRPIESGVDVPLTYRSGERATIVGFVGYDAEESRNMRIYIKNFNPGT